MRRPLTASISAGLHDQPMITTDLLQILSLLGAAVGVCVTFSLYNLHAREALFKLWRKAQV